MILEAGTYKAAMLASVIAIALIYPILSLAERLSWFGKLLVEKSKDEIRRSFLMLMIMFMAVISVSWGIFGQPEPAAVSILMWGTGDAAAALVGIPFGKHKVHCRLADGKKSWEGSFAMFIVSFLTGFLLLKYAGWKDALTLAFAGAPAGAVTELFSPSEYDTFTVPVVILGVVLFIGLR